MAAAKQTSDRWWDDSDFQDKLIALITYDDPSAKQCVHLLEPDDFKPIKGVEDGQARWLVAERAIRFYEKHHECIGALVRSDVLEYARTINAGAMKVGELTAYIERLEKIKRTSPSAVIEKVTTFKSRILKMSALEELVDLQAAGGLTDEKWRELFDKGLVTKKGLLNTSGFLENPDERQARRSLDLKRRRAPLTFIEPLDVMVQGPAPGQVGLVIAPYKRGKSQFLCWIDVAYARQRLNVIHFTLEDPKYVVEDRLDSIVTHIPIKSLTNYPAVFRRRFDRFRAMTKANIQIVDGTGGGVSVPVIEKIYLKLREEGFNAHAIVIDYDEHLVPQRRYKEKRFETDETYKEFCHFCGQHRLIGWTAAQTQRDTRHLKILSGDKVADDIGKARKVTCAFSLGKGEWTDHSIYLWVAAHKNDVMEVGTEIIPDFTRGLIYDSEATSRAVRDNNTEEEE
jgi:hypothetical protein